MEEKIFGELKYLISYPAGFCDNKKYPLIIYLHGAGSRSDSTETLSRSRSVVKLLEKQDARGFILLAPLCNGVTWNEWMRPLVHFVEHVRELSYVDQDRVYLTGNSMGGYGTWALSTLRPDWFAAAMPLCGGGIAGFARNLVNLPIRAFHGLRDTVVDPVESLQMAKAVNRLGGHAELILYPDLEHNCWSRVYSDDANYDWLFSHSLAREQIEMEQFRGDY